MNNITFKQLRAFSTVAQERSFTRAANKLNLSQSALTIAVKQLETEVDLKLFDRTTRSVHLTYSGSLFLPMVERMLRELSRSLDDLSAVAGREKGLVTAAASASFLCCILAPTVAKLRPCFPGIHVKLLNIPDNLSKRVMEEEIDFGITNVSSVPHGLESFLILSDVFGVVFPRGHWLAERDGPLNWADLDGESFVGMPAGTMTREILDRDEVIAQLVGSPVCEASSIFAIGALIRSGMGIALVPAQVARAITMDGLMYRPLSGPRLHRSLSLIKRKGRSLSPASVEVLGFMMNELEAMHSDLIDIQVRKDEFLKNFF